MTEWSTATTNCDKRLTTIRPVLILGAGINGAAVARELVLNGVPVVVVDRADIAAGATSRSSRLIHGGLRYLEYGDFGLVSESLEERERLLHLAPQFVRPLRLYIPLRQRLGGFLHASLRFLKLSRTSLGSAAISLLPDAGRGLWLVKVGLSLYDFLAKGSTLPPHGVVPSSEFSAPRVDCGKFGWLCAFSDAQMLYPERFVVALLEDARRAAAERGVGFEVYTHCCVELLNGRATIQLLIADCGLRIEDRAAGTVQERCNSTAEYDQARRIPPATHQSAILNPQSEIPHPSTFTPSLIVNATGAAGDFTLDELHIPSKPLFGGTKGSHFLTFHTGLREAIGNQAIYAETDDGRLVFVLPFGDEAVLVGTTDERFDDRPENAVASGTEIDYLLSVVNQVFGDVDLTKNDVAMHYSGVRPLPYAGAGSTASIPRGHSIDVNDRGAAPVLTLIGGKLTTCRALGEEVADIVLERLQVARTAHTRERTIPGAEDYPPDEQLRARFEELATRYSLDVQQVRAIWMLCGNRIDEIFSKIGGGSRGNIAGTVIPREFVQWVIANEWVGRLEDLVERRLMLLFDRRLSVATLNDLADCLIEAGLLDAGARDAAIHDELNRMQRLYGRAVSSGQ